MNSINHRLCYAAVERDGVQHEEAGRVLGKSEAREARRWAGLTLVMSVGATQLVCARADGKAEPKTAGSRSTSSSAAASPSATAAPSATATSNSNVTVSPTFSVTMPPTAAPPPSPRPAPPTYKFDVRSDHQSGGVTAGIYQGADQQKVEELEKQQGTAQERVRELEKELRAVREYSSVAQLTYTGVPQEYSSDGPIVYTSELSTMMKPAWEKINATQMTFRCDPPALSALQQVIKRYPKFPFAYFALASCDLQTGNLEWKANAIKATEILQQATTIDGHAHAHDEALQRLVPLLATL